MCLRFVIWLALTLTTSILWGSPKITVQPDVASGVYEPGSKVTWTVAVTDEEQPVQGDVTYTVRAGGLTEIATGSQALTEGKAQITASRADAGTLLLSITYKPSKEAKAATAVGGAAFAPGDVKASLPPPDDFDAFWEAKIAELDAVPMEVRLEPVDIGDAKVEYFKVTLNNIRGRKIYGQLAKPAGKSDLPALLQVQWAGVYPLHKDWVVGHARNGWLAFNIMAHDLPMDEKPEFYQQQAQKELNDYPGIGNDDRETSYFLPMFLSCRRAVDFLTQRDDWNKQALVVHGGSQGGY